MNIYELNRLLDNKELIDAKIKECIDKNNLVIQNVSVSKIEGHIQKSEHNLEFVHENINLGFLDWAIAGCYYACYHAALSLIMSKGYFSRNHLATLYILIKEFYDKGLDLDDVKILSELLDYHDVLFYVESKNKREDATYSSKIFFDKDDVELLNLKSKLFISKVKALLSHNT
jgi:uncharacterized protein (UPF0332 family)